MQTFSTHVEVRVSCIAYIEAETPEEANEIAQQQAREYCEERLEKFPLMTHHTYPAMAVAGAL